jgi:hypothetical protein
MSIIEDIYRGECYPTERIIPTDECYRKSKKLAHALFDELNDQLTKEQQQLLDDYLGAMADTEGCAYLEYFRKGVLFGAQLQRELSEGIVFYR